MKYIERSERVPVREAYDLIAVGGVTGVTAAQHVMIHFDDAWVPEKAADDAHCGVGHI